MIYILAKVGHSSNLLNQGFAEKYFEVYTYKAKHKTEKKIRG